MHRLDYWHSALTVKKSLKSSFSVNGSHLEFVLDYDFRFGLADSSMFITSCFMSPPPFV